MPGTFKRGDKVQHGQLGLGTVATDTDGSGNVTARFQAGVWTGPVFEVSRPADAVTSYFPV